MPESRVAGPRCTPGSVPDHDEPATGRHPTADPFHCLLLEVKVGHQDEVETTAHRLPVGNITDDEVDAGTFALSMFAAALDPDRREVQSRDPPPARGQPHRVASLARADIERATGSQ